MHWSRSIAWLLLAPLLLACASEGPDALGVTAEAIRQCPSQTVEGIDVFDGQGPIDWAAVADSGVAFAMIKATQGTYDTQSTFAANWAGARRMGLRRGAYHFFDPTEDGAAQARSFLAVVGVLAAGDLPPMLDLECPDGDSNCLGTGGHGAAGVAPASAIAAGVWAWLHAVERATGRKPIVYTFSSYFASSGVDASGLDAYPLFLASPASASCFGVPAPWAGASFWQYSWAGAVPGVPSAVDRDRFLGSSADFALFGLAPRAAARGDAGCH